MSRVVEMAMVGVAEVNAKESRIDVTDSSEAHHNNVSLDPGTALENSADAAAARKLASTRRLSLLFIMQEQLPSILEIADNRGHQHNTEFARSWCIPFPGHRHGSRVHQSWNGNPVVVLQA